MSKSFDVILRQRLSADRFAPYERAAGSLPAAVALYEWNIAVCGAVYESLHVVEVVLRNAMHEHLARAHHAAARQGSWLEDPARLLQQRARDEIRAARARVARSGAGPTDGRVVAELGFGFWRYLLARRYTHTLWVPALRHAFTHLPRQELALVEQPVARLHQLRNRVAHLEPVHARDLRADHAAMGQVLAYICPQTRAWFDGLARVPAVLAARPAWRPCAPAGRTPRAQPGAVEIHPL